MEKEILTFIGTFSNKKFKGKEQKIIYTVPKNCYFALQDIYIGVGAWHHNTTIGTHLYLKGRPGSSATLHEFPYAEPGKMVKHKESWTAGIRYDAGEKIILEVYQVYNQEEDGMHVLYILAGRLYSQP